MAFVPRDDYLESLASLVPYHSTHFPQELPHLQNILNLCKRKWICDFLFNSDPTHITILTAPFFTRNAIACSVKAKRFEPPVMQFPYGFHFDGSIVFVPAYSVDHISVGFGIEEKAYSCTQSFDCEAPRDVATSVPRHIEQFRYVRDDKTGTIINLYDFDQFFQFDYFHHLSTQCRQRSSSRFDRQTLMSLVETESSLDEEKLLPAMLCLQISDEFRKCPTCGWAPDKQCRCPLGLVSPKHSLDFSNHAAQMASHAGSFEGMMHFKRYQHGVARDQAILGSRITVQGGTSHELVNRLTTWVVRQHLQGVQQDPLASIFPSTGLPQDWDASAAPLLLPEPSATSVALELPGRSQFRQNQEPFIPGDDGVEVGTSRALVTGPGQASKQAYYPGTSRGIVQQIVPPFAPSTQAVDVSRAQPLDHLYSPAVGASSNVNVATSGADLYTAVEGATCNVNVTTSGLNYGAGRGTAARLTASQLQEMERERQREIKKELKKERNRASAQRSNLKKKIENDARKQEIQRLKSLEVELRARERSLREENVRLRNMTKGWSSQGSDPG